ncbi:MAG: hypothetical protein JZU67_05075, partial [Burkholderiaceae bacterium]|nr:hypothetical protein [Burkholderiaceae bacterium]
MGDILPLLTVDGERFSFVNDLYSGPQFPDNILRRLNQISQRAKDVDLDQRPFPLRCTSNISIVLVYTIFATSNISFASVSAGNPE